MAIKVPILLIVVCLAATAIACDIDGETMSIQLVNDTPQRVGFLQCHSDSCEDAGGGRSGESVEPGDYYTSIAVLDVVSWYVVVDVNQASLGCLRIDYRHREAHPQLFASRAMDCP